MGQTSFHLVTLSFLSLSSSGDWLGGDVFSFAFALRSALLGTDAGCSTLAFSNSVGGNNWPPVSDGRSLISGARLFAASM